jgi:hypothetical protein
MGVARQHAPSCDWSETVPLDPQRTVSHFKTRRDAQRKRAGHGCPSAMTAGTLAAQRHDVRRREAPWSARRSLPTLARALLARF